MKQKRIITWAILLMFTLTLGIGAIAEGLPQEQTGLYKRANTDVVGNAFGEDILFEDIVFFYDQYVYSNVTAQGADLAMYPQFQGFFEKASVDAAVVYRVFEKIGEEKGVYPFSEEKIAEITSQVNADYTTAVESNITAYLETIENPTEEQKAEARTLITQYIIGDSMTEEKFLKEMVDNSIINELYTLIFEDITKGATVSDQEVQAVIDELVAQDKAAAQESVYNFEIAKTYMGEVQYYQPAGYRGVNHILLQVDEELLKTYQELQARLEEQNDKEETAATQQEGVTPTEGSDATEPVTQEQIEEARAAIFSSVQATVDEIMGKLDAGESFVSLIDQYGTDPGMKEEPAKSQGYAVHMESLFDPAFIAAVFSDKVAKVGDVSDPVIGTNGVHIVHYASEIAEGPMALSDETRSGAELNAIEIKKNDLFNQEINKWKDTSQSKYFIPGYDEQGNVSEATQEPAAEKAGDDQTQGESAQDSSDAPQSETAQP